MYDKLFVDVCGMFNPLHYLSIGCFFIGLVALLWKSRKLTAKQANKLLSWIAAAVLICEIIKIVNRIVRGQGPDSWVPLYYCSLYIFAIWMSRTGCVAAKRAGCAYMTMGGITASIFFIIYPSTSLGMYPLFHSASIHSFLYHLAMCYSGLILLWKGLYVPSKQDGLNYFIFVFSACVLAAVLNEIIGTNCMFLMNPFGLPVLQPILEHSKALYMLIVAVAQSILMFWLNYGVYCVLSRKYVRNKETHTIAN